MAFFEWKDEFSGGIEPIDEQHKVIVRLMNELFEVIRTGKDGLEIKGVFVELLKYSNYHFSLELRLFERYHYEGEAAHRREHEHFIERIKDLMVSDYLTDRNVPLETLHYLRSWFRDHMLKTDMDYCRFFSFKSCMDEIDSFLKSQASA
jgi:hemerythrin-like metal-binding protein